MKRILKLKIRPWCVNRQIRPLTTGAVTIWVIASTAGAATIAPEIQILRGSRRQAVTFVVVLTIDAYMMETVQQTPIMSISFQK